MHWKKEENDLDPTPTLCVVMGLGQWTKWWHDDFLEMVQRMPEMDWIIQWLVLIAPSGEKKIVSWRKKNDPVEPTVMVWRTLTNFLIWG